MRSREASVWLCGELRVELDGANVASRLPARQGRLLFGYLVLSRGRVVRRDELVDAIWPDRAPQDADAALASVLARLRRLLGPERLPTRGPVSLRLGDSAYVDVEVALASAVAARRALDVARPEEALDLATATLEIIEQPLLPEFERAWLDDRRRELADLVVPLVEIAVEAALRVGGGALRDAEWMARRGVEREPFRESAHAALMRVLAARGDSAEALRVYEALRVRLRDELGASPSGALLELHRRLLSDDTPTATAHVRHGDVRLAATLQMERRKPLVGRESELAALSAAWTRVTEGERHVVLVAGEPGIGKTRLAAEVAGHVADRGHRVLFGACDEALAVAGRPLADALRPYFASTDLPTLREQLGPYLGAVASLEPQLAARVPDVEREQREDPATAQWWLLDGVVHLVRRAAAAAPLLLVLDDIHWADELTLLATRRLLRADDLGRVAIIATYRDSEPARSGLLSDLIADAARRTDVSRLELGPLRVEDIAALTERSFADGAPSASALHAVTDGNPFFLGEVLDALAHGDADSQPMDLTAVPAGVRAVLRVRLTRIPQASTRVLATAALLGREFRADVLLAVCDERESVLEALERGESAHLIRPVPRAPGVFMFAHALVMRALSDELPTALRMRLHERIALTLSANPQAQATAAAELALHFREAAPLGHDDDARRWATAAGDEAMTNLAFTSAADHYAAALEAQRRLGSASAAEEIALRVAHGRALRLAGAPEGFAALVDTAVAAEGASEFELMAEALLAVSQAYATEVAADTPLTGLLRRALEELPERDGPTRARLLSFLAMETLHAAGPEQPEALADEALTMARRSENPLAIANALVALEWAAMHPAAVNQRELWARELTDIARAHRLPFHECMAHIFTFTAMLEQGEAAAAAAALEAAARTPGQSSGKWVVAHNSASWALLTDPLDVAEQAALTALAVGREASVAESILFQGFGGQLACIRMLQGRLPELEEPVAQLAASQGLSAAWRSLLARIRCLQGRADEARDALTSGMHALAQQSSRHHQWSTAAALLAETACDLREQPACETLFELLQPFSGLVTWNVGCSLGPFDLFLGRLAATLGRPRIAEHHLRRAVTLCEQMGAQAFLAIARHELAAQLPVGADRNRLETLARTSAHQIGVKLPAAG